MISTFTDVQPTLDNYWRSIILFGKNTACYKFALAQSLLEFADQQYTQISKDVLAEKYALHICNHLKSSNTQGTNPSNNYLATCSDFNAGVIDKDKLVNITKKEGFRYVIERFHNVNGGDLPVKFYSGDKNSKEIVLSDEIMKLSSLGQFKSLAGEVDSRWSLVEAGWRMKINNRLLRVHYDVEQRSFYETDLLKRTNLTSARSALNGYQKGHCFYCYDAIDIQSESDHLAEVDHFIPHKLKGYLANTNLDGVWNLVLSCQSCNRGQGGKLAKIPKAYLLERLHKRNSFLINSHHPLRETLIAQTGTSNSARVSFLRDTYGTACSNLIQTWEPEQIGSPLF